MIQLQTIQKQPESLEDLGMRPKLVEQVRQLIGSDEGLVLISSLPSGGLSTTLSAVLQAADRFTRHFVMFEDQSRREREIDNIEVNTFQIANGQSPTNDLIRLLRTEPDVIVAPDLSDGKVTEILCHHACDGRLVISTVRAKDAAEALLRVLALKVPADDFAPAAKGVINQRLVRKLCEKCKEPYTPDPKLIQKLGLPPERVDTFYREPQNRTEEDEVCDSCGGIGYQGRTAIFEFLLVNEALREAMAKRPKLDSLRNTARQAGNRTLQEEGIVLVARGVTSLPELSRVLKQ